MLICQMISALIMGVKSVKSVHVSTPWRMSAVHPTQPVLAQDFPPNLGRSQTDAARFGASRTRAHAPGCIAAHRLACVQIAPGRTGSQLARTSPRARTWPHLNPATRSDILRLAPAYPWCNLGVIVGFRHWRDAFAIALNLLRYRSVI